MCINNLCHILFIVGKQTPMFNSLSLNIGPVNGVKVVLMGCGTECGVHWSVEEGA